MSIQWPHIYILIFLAGTAGLLLLTPAAQKIAAKLDIMDRPSGEKHKFHGKATPLLGGAAMFSGWLLILAAGLLLVRYSSSIPGTENIKNHFPGAFSVLGRIGFLVLGAGIATLLGTIDDVRHLKAHWKFLGQFIVAVIAVAGVSKT